MPMARHIAITRALSNNCGKKIKVNIASARYSTPKSAIRFLIFSK